MQNQKRPLVPIQLISFDSNKNVILNQEAAQIIQKFMTEKLAIISVVGKYRTGKSFILNRVLLGTTKGFEVGPTINACTKGLWIWPQVIEMETDQGKIPALIMDTQGLGSLQQGQNTDTKIFLLATLLSSYLIYNSMGSIDQRAIQSLGLIVNLSNILQKANRSDHDDIVSCFPSFMWLVRDFFLKLVDQNGDAITSKQYLQNALRAQKGRSDTIQNKNKIRSQLRQYFRERQCCTLVRPTNHDNDLKFLNTIPQNKLRSEFIQQIRQLKNKLFKSVRAKTFQGKPCNPQAFVQMCRAFVKAINDGGVPSISSNWDNVCNSQSQKIIQQIQQKHQYKIQELISLQSSLSQIQIHHKQILNEGYKQIDSTFLGVLQKQRKKKKLKKTLKQFFNSIRQQQSFKQFDNLKGLIEQAFIQILKQIRVNKFESFQQVLQRFEVISPTNNQPQMMGEFYSKLKNISVQYIRCLQEKWKTQNILLKQKQQWMEKEYTQKKLELQQQLQQNYDKVRKDQMQKYKLRCMTQDQRQKINILEEEVFDQKQTIIDLQQQIKCINSSNQTFVSKVKEQFETKVKELNILLNCKDIDYQQLQASSKLKLEKYESQNKKVLILENTIQQLRYQICVLEEQKQSLEDSIKYEYRDQNPSEKQLNLKLRILEKQKHCLLKQLQNQKSINQGLIKTFQSNPSFILANQMQTLQKQSSQLKSQIKILKQYQKVLLSCDLLKCRLCQNSFSFGQFKTHLLLCNKPVYLDVSYQMDSQSHQLVFIIQVQKSGFSWKLNKSRKHVHSFLKSLNKQEAQQFIDQCSDVQDFQKRRVLLSQILTDLLSLDFKNHRIIQFLALDLHDKKHDQQNLQQIAETSFKQVTNKIYEQQQNNLSGVNSKKNQLFKTCKFGSNKGILFPI